MSDRGEIEGDPRKTLAYMESLRALTQQATVLDALRTRTGILLTAMSIAATFLGAQVFEEDSISTLGWIGAGAFALAALGALAVLLPWNKWEFSMDATTIIDGYVEDKEHPATLDEMHVEFARLNQGCFKRNDRRLGWLFWAFRVAVATLTLSIAFWLAAIAVSADGTNPEKNHRQDQLTGRQDQ